jgi:hypothetical protein
MASSFVYGGIVDMTLKRGNCSRLHARDRLADIGAPHAHPDRVSSVNNSQSRAQRGAMRTVFCVQQHFQSAMSSFATNSVT